MSSKEESKKDAGPKYSRLSESLRHAAPGALQCSMFCGGKQCKYENPARFKSEEMAIRGLYSSWVTNDILATARPSSEIIKNYKIIEQFKQNGIKSIINLQRPDEHASCGSGVIDSGFSYEAEEFMQAEIFYYNFGWNDYGVRSLESILDMVKVMSFALQEGKAAVHCHAGLGRTGVLISCYLIFSRRLGAEEAIHLMRENRPKAVQTRGQIECVKDFSKFLTHLWVVFSSCHPGFKKFTLSHYLTRQKHLLHGLEARELKNLPKIVCITCSRLLELASVKAEDTNIKWSFTVDVKKVFSEVEEQEEQESNGTDDSTRDELPLTVDELKHNPYVEAGIGCRSVDSVALQRSQSTDGAVSEDDELLVQQNLSVCMTGLGKSRTHSESDIYQSSGGSALPPSPSPTRKHAVRLEPLNRDTRKHSVTKNKSSPESTDETDIISSEHKIINEARKKSTELAAESASPSIGSTDQASSASKEDRNLVARAMCASACANSGVQNRTDKLKRKVNAADAGWEEIKDETDAWVLSRLLWTWLEDLEEPVLSASDVDYLSSAVDDPINAVKKLKKGVKDTLECLVTTICELDPLPYQTEERVLRRLAMVLTHNPVLPLTSPRASLERAASTSSSGGAEEADAEDQTAPQGDVEEADSETAFEGNDPCSSVSSSPSYRMLLFLRTLILVLKGRGIPRPS